MYSIIRNLKKYQYYYSNVRRAEALHGLQLNQIALLRAWRKKKSDGDYKEADKILVP